MSKNIVIKYQIFAIFSLAVWLLLLKTGPQSAFGSDGKADLKIEFGQNEDILATSCTMNIAAEWQHVWAVLVDYDNCHRFIPGILHSKLIEDRGDVKIVDQIAKSGISILKVKARVKMKITEEPFDKVGFEQVSGDLDIFRGMWQITKSDTGSTTINYYSELRPKIPLPKSVLKHIQRKDLPKVMLAIQQRAEYLAQQDVLPGLTD